MPATCKSRLREHLISALPLAGLVALVLIAYWPAFRCGFLDWDDDIYVTANPHVRAGLTPSSVHYAWTTRDFSNWIPLTWMAYLVQATLFGIDATAFHATNVVLHAANVVLLATVLCRFTSSPVPSIITAALFAVHPLHVESVAWVSELKDVLSTLFLLLTLLAYERYTRAPSLAAYAAVAACMTAGLLAKPMLVTLPLLLLLVDAWPACRIAGFAPHRPAKTIPELLREKVPLVLIAGLAALVTLSAQRTAMGNAGNFPAWIRAANAADATVWYLEKTVVPLNLCAFYPHPMERIDVGRAVICGGAIVALTALVAISRSGPAGFGWLWFLCSLAPVSGLIQVGGQAHADRYAYVPHIGLFAGAVWELQRLCTSVRHGLLVGAAIAAVGLGWLTAATRAQTATWRDSQSLWQHALAVVPGCPVALVHLATANLDQNEFDSAESRFTAALDDSPGHVAAIVGLGRTARGRGDDSRARGYFSWALRLEPRNPRALRQLAELGVADASTHVAPPAPAAVAANKRGLLAARAGDVPAALREFEAAIEADPNFAFAHTNAALAHETMGNLVEAVPHLEAALASAPDNVEAYHSLRRIRRLTKPAKGSPP